jgi:outer membrane receptor protein involved in Fe transport
VPKHSVKFGARYQTTGRLALSLFGRAVSGQYLFGDEANLTPKVPGYVVLNAHASYKLFDHVEIYGTVQNLLDKHYATFGTFSSTGEVPTIEVPNAQNTRALSPAPPIAFYGGTRIKF